MGIHGKYSFFLGSSIAILLLSAPRFCFAQPAIIDSISVDEGKREIIVYGALGTLQGMVFVDSISLPVIFWSDSICQSTIPDTGKGSAGLVEILTNGYRSKGRILTSLKSYGYSLNDQLQPYFSVQTVDETSSSYHFRVDIESRILHRSESIQLYSAQDSRQYSFHQTIDEQHIEKSSRDTSIISISFTIDLYGHMLYYYGISPSNFLCSLDTEYVPVFRSNRDQQAHSHQEISENGDWGSSFLPRPEYFHLTYTPIAFPHDSSYFGNDMIKLSWTISSAPLEYEFQVAKDSSFLQKIEGSTVSGKSSFAQNAGEGKYFWRVRVKDSVGEGRWSNIASFQYLTVNDVKEKYNSYYSVCPNPLSTKTIFSFSLPKEELVLLKIYTPLGNEVATVTNRKFSSGNQHVEFDGSHLPSGVYYYRLQISEHIETKELIITH